MVKFVSSKEMFQNTEQFVQKGTYKTVCHGTSVNVICYMAQQRKQRTRYGNKSSANYYNATISHYLHPTLNRAASTCNGGHRSTEAGNIALLPSDVMDFIIFFFAQLLLTCDPKVTNASTRERIRGTLQTSLYRQGKREVGAKGWSVKFRLSLGDIFVRFSQLLTEVESDSLCSDPLVSLQSLNSDLGLLTGLSCRNLPAATVVFCSVSERCLAKVKALYTQDIHLTFKCGGSFCTSSELIVTGLKKKPATNSLPLSKGPPYHCLLSLQRGSHVWVQCCS